MTITVSDGETLSIPAGERTVSETINLSGSVTLDGTLDLQGTATEATAGVGEGVGTATPLAIRSIVAVGDGEGVGTAIDGAFRAVIAAGDGDAVGSGTPIVAVPAVRREEATLVYDDRDEFDLGLDT